MFFRDSKITQILQPYLTGTRGQTFIIANFNPSENLFDESLFAFKFCSTAKQVSREQKLNKTRRLTGIFDVTNTIRTTELIDDTDQLSVEYSQQDIELQALRVKVRTLSEKLKMFNKEKDKEIGDIKKDFFNQLNQRKKLLDKTVACKDTEIENWKRIYSERMEINNQHFQNTISELQENIQKLETELFNVRTDLIETKNELENKDKLIESKDLFIKKLTKQVSIN